MVDQVVLNSFEAVLDDKLEVGGRCRRTVKLSLEHQQIACQSRWQVGVVPRSPIRRNVQPFQLNLEAGDIHQPQERGVGGFAGRRQ
jgi:hypothetical protein